MTERAEEQQCWLHRAGSSPLPIQNREVSEGR